MTNYLQELLPPEYRNLAINPSGEGSIAATWVGSNGAVSTGVAPVGITPPRGTGCAAYVVTDETTRSYWFGPLGPSDEAAHRSAFKIPNGGQVSAMASLAAPVATWVRLRIAWLVVDYNRTGPLAFNEIGSSEPGAPMLLGTSWQQQKVLVPAGGSAPGATHWRLEVAVYGADPSVNPTAPAVGTTVYADQVFVPDSGADLSAVAYADGDSPGWVWEGQPHYSSSRTSDLSFQPPEGDAPEPTAIEPDGTDGIVDALPAEADAVSEPSVPYVPPPDLGAKTTATDDRPAYARAADILAWRKRAERLCLKGDVQLGPLVLNTMDESDVVWVVSEIEGWWTLPEPDVPDQPRGWFDGSYETRGRYSSRTITLSGSFVPPDPSLVAGARDRLLRACNLAHRGDWFMTHDDPSPERRDTKGSKVWLAGQPLIQTVNEKGRTDFSIALRAPDPVKYGIKEGVPPGYETATLITSNSEFPEREYPRAYPWAYPEAIFGNTNFEAYNRGNTVVWPTLVMRGPTNGAVRVYNLDTEQEMRVVRKLFAGEELTIDCFNRQVTVNGAGNYRFYLDVDVDWLMLQPGVNRLYFAEEELGGIRTELEVQWRSGWIG